MVSIGICDDQLFFLKQLEQMLITVLEDQGIPYHLELFSKSTELISSTRDFDLLFLDIDMPELDGLSAAAFLRNQNKQTIIVFVSSVKEKVFETFSVRPLNFLVKPVDANQLRSVLLEAIRDVQAKATDWLVFEYHHGKQLKIRSSDLVYVETNQRGTKLHLLNQVYESTMKLTDVWKVLEDRDFYKIYTSFIVNLSYIKEYHRSHVVTQNGVELSMSRGKYADFKTVYLKYLKRKL